MERYAQDHAEVREELAAIEVTLEKYVQLQGLPADADLANQVLAKIGDGTAGTKPTPPDQKPPPPKKGNNWLPPLLGIALLGALAGLFYLYTQLQQVQTQLSATTQQLQTLQTNCDLIRAENAQLQQKIGVLENTAFQPVLLTDPNNASQNQVAVYWNPQAQQSYLNVLSLPQAPANRVYQLWAIVDGTPTDMGVIEVQADSSDLIEIPFIPDPDAFAITLETSRQPTPDLTALVVIGEV